MAKIIMSINGQDYESANEWESIDECMTYCFDNPDANEFPGYDGDGSEGAAMTYRTAE